MKRRFCMGCPGDEHAAYGPMQWHHPCANRGLPLAPVQWEDRTLTMPTERRSVLCPGEMYPPFLLYTARKGLDIGGLPLCLFR